VNVVLFLLGNSPASELYVPTFRNTVCSNFIGRVNKNIFFLFTRPVKMEQCSETSAHKIHTPGNHPKERLQQNLIRRPVKPGLPIEAHHRATSPILHQCVLRPVRVAAYTVHSTGVTEFSCMSLCILIRLQDKITAYILPINLPKNAVNITYSEHH